MPADPGAEILYRSGLQSLIASSPVFQEWSGLDEAQALNRISWPDYPMSATPAVTLIVGPSTVNHGPALGSMNEGWKPNGSIVAIFWDKVDLTGINLAIAADDPEALAAATKVEDTRFGTWVTGLRDEMINSVRYADGTFKFSAVTMETVPWRRSSSGAERENPEDQIAAALTGSLWRCPMTFSWGAFA